MNTLKIKLQNCYGIKKLEKELDFSSERTYAIYAPNGVMKTSFAKTFNDLALGVNSKDLIFPQRETIREIKREDGSQVTSEQVFVIEPYNQAFNSEKMSTLLVNKELKKRYDEIHIKIDQEKDRLLKELKIFSGLKEDDVEREVSQTFTSEDNRLFASLGRVEKEVTDTSGPELSDISYKEIFNDKVLAFLKTKDFKDKIAEYIKKYDELIESSKYFKKGVFNHNNASVIAKSLMDNGFFEANHSVSLNTKEGGGNAIRTKEELEKVIEEEKNAIMSNPELAKAFEELDSKLKANKELRDFRDYLLNNLKIISELKNLESFKQKLWVSYLKSQKELYVNFMKEYQLGKDELDKIIEKARTEETQWRNVIDIFNKRFSVPFRLTMQNQDDVILKRNIPSIAFVFKDQSEETPVDKQDLLQALSSGEKRALYILNIIFEVQARKEESQETLFVVDDIADSFDYKNKYAIIEYLKDISGEANFYQIILTHNFDFFRTVQSRFISYNHCLMVEKTKSETKIIESTYIKNPFKYWMNHLDDDKKLLASIPFVRNLIEYTKDETDDNFLMLTSLLHIKSDTDSILISDLQSVYNVVFPSAGITLGNSQKKVVDLIFELADGCLTTAESINLENKILLSMAIRLKAEKYILSKIADKSEPDGNQTGKLIQRFKSEFGSISTEQSNIEMVEQVNLMTPENIHLNSFMYEPILDMSDEHLKKLYEGVGALK